VSKKELYFLRESTTQFICQYDSRFSYCAYIPQDYSEDNKHEYKMAVIVHGSLRNAQEYRDAFIDFAENNKVIILAPLFPGGITEPWESDSYKFVRVNDIEYDEILLAMIREFSEKLGIHIDKFLLHGYSGGGQFVHRFYYLHPDRILGLSIGAPGNVTVLDPSKPWYLGIGNYREKFNRAIPYNIMRQVPILMVVGRDDTEEWMINDKEAPFWNEGFMETGKNRIDRLRTLRKSFEDHDIRVNFREVPDIGHEGLKILPIVKDFFSKVLKNKGY